MEKVIRKVSQEGGGVQMIRTRLQGNTPFFPNMLNNGKVEVCLKEDVDKTLAEKDKELRHHKYKRCLAMTKYCHESAMWLEEYGITKSATFMLRWQKRWLELAEKFEEAK